MIFLLLWFVAGVVITLYLVNKNRAHNELASRQPGLRAYTPGLPVVYTPPIPPLEQALRTGAPLVDVVRLAEERAERDFERQHIDY